MKNPHGDLPTITWSVTGLQRLLQLGPVMKPVILGTGSNHGCVLPVLKTIPIFSEKYENMLEYAYLWIQSGSWITKCREHPQVRIPFSLLVAGAVQVAHSSWANCVPRGLGRAPAVVRRVAEVGQVAWFAQMGLTENLRKPSNVI